MDISETISSSDFVAIAEISKKYNLGNWVEIDYRNAYSDPNYKILTAGEKTDLYGFIVFRVLYDEIEIINICVDDLFRRKGIAKSLLNRCLVQSEILNKTKIWLEVRQSNDAAIKLYTSFGFITFGVRKEYYVSPTEDAVIMLKSRIK